MKSYIFIFDCQVFGLADGKTPEDAFDYLLGFSADLRERFLNDKNDFPFVLNKKKSRREKIHYFIVQDRDMRKLYGDDKDDSGLTTNSQCAWL